MQPQQATLKFTHTKIYILPWAWVYTLLLWSPIPWDFKNNILSTKIQQLTAVRRAMWEMMCVHQLSELIGVRQHTEQRGVRGECGVWPISIWLWLYISISSGTQRCDCTPLPSTWHPEHRAPLMKHTARQEQGFGGDFDRKRRKEPKILWYFRFTFTAT